MCVMRSRKRQWLGGCVGLLVLFLCYSSVADGVPEKMVNMRDYWTIEEVRPTDRDGLVAWARGICHGLDIEAAAKAINVAPTADAVVGALTDSLPSDIRNEISKVCFEALATKPETPT